MKKLACTIMLALMAAVSTTAFASGDVTYEVGDNSVTAADAAATKTVLVKAANGDIVYVGQTDAVGGYTAADKFLLKAEAADGAYTIQFNGKQAKTFYIGMGSALEDIKLEKIEEGGELDNGDGTKSVGYKCENATGTFSGVIIKSNGKYYGAELNAKSLTVENASLGIQINGIPSDDNAPEVWLTSRSFELASEKDTVAE